MLDRTRQTLSARETEELLSQMFALPENYISLELFRASIADRDEALDQHQKFVATGELPEIVINFCLKRLVDEEQVSPATTLTSPQHFLPIGRMPLLAKTKRRRRSLVRPPPSNLVILKRRRDAARPRIDTPK